MQAAVDAQDAQEGATPAKPRKHNHRAGKKHRHHRSRAAAAAAAGQSADAAAGAEGSELAAATAEADGAEDEESEEGSDTESPLASPAAQAPEEADELLKPARNPLETPVPGVATVRCAVQAKEEVTNGAKDGDWWWRCQRCNGDKVNYMTQAKVFCPDCPKGRQFYCHKCCALEHDWDTKSRLHSMEAIDPHQATFFISVLLDFVGIPLAVFALIRRAGIPEGYNDGVDVCPLVDHVRTAFTKLDAGVSQLYTKPHFATVCNLEDSYIRLFVDAFVRCALTNTDCAFLLAATVWRAGLFHTFFIRKVLVPVAVVCQVIVTFVCWKMQDMMPERMHSKFEQWLVNWVQKPSNRLPKTIRRERPSIHYVERFKYEYGRNSRRVEWLRQTAQNRLVGLAKFLFCMPVAVRLCTIFFRMGWFFGMMVPDSWRAEYVELAKVTRDPISGNIFEAVLKQLSLAFVKNTRRHAPTVVLATFDTVVSLAIRVNSALWNYYVYIFPIVAILYCPYWFAKRLHAHQSGQFHGRIAPNAKFDAHYPCYTKWAPAST